MRIKSLRPKLLPAATLASLLLTLAVLIAWWWSYLSPDAWLLTYRLQPIVPNNTSSNVVRLIAKRYPEDAHVSFNFNQFPFNVNDQRVAAFKLLEMRRGRFVILSQTVGTPPNPSFNHEPSGHSQVAAAEAVERRFIFEAVSFVGSNGTGGTLLLSIDSPARTPANSLERIGFALRDDRYPGSLKRDDGRKPPGQIAGITMPSASVTQVMIPHWFLALLFAISTVLLARAWRRRRRALAMAGERCVTCGYDLRQTPERCPECGREVEQRASAVG